MGRRVKRVFTWEAVLVGWLFSMVVGAILGIGLALVFQSALIGLISAVVGMLFSIDAIFRGTNE